MCILQNKHDQLRACSITRRYKNKDKLCIFFVVTWGGPALLEIPDIMILGILNMRCNTENPEDTFKKLMIRLNNINKSNGSPIVSSKNKWKKDYFIPGPEREADMKASAVITQSIPNEVKCVFTSIHSFKWAFSLQVKAGPNHMRYP